MKKSPFIMAALIVVVVLVAVAGAFLWYSVGQPLYEPGMVRAGKNLRAPLMPPVQPENAYFWKMEEDIQLYNCSVKKSSSSSDIPSAA